MSIDYSTLYKSSRKDDYKSAHATIEKKLDEHDRPFIEDPDDEEFVIKAVHNEQIVGGVAGTFDLGWLYIELLWVDSSERHSGIGTRLMQQAEQIARERNKIGITLETHGFQAPDFYPKLGFKPLAEIADWPPRYGMTIFVKRLADSDC